MTEQTKRPPLVSAIVPTYNASRYVTECLDSIAAQQDDISFLSAIQTNYHPNCCSNSNHEE